ncbi:MAG: STAS domain-containing protein [bacterium]|nr:STAS domain-containing protein [bacterium]
MIYFKETFSEDGDVFIRIEGELNNATMPVLRDLCAGHLGKKRKLSINLEDVNRIDNASLAYLKSIRSQVRLDGLSQYLKLELDEAGSIKQRK